MGAVVHRGEGVIVDTTAYGLFAARFVSHVEKAEGRVRWRFVLVSHRHFDHWGAASVVAAPVVGHRLTDAALATYDAAWLSENIKKWTAAGKLRQRHPSRARSGDIGWRSPLGVRRGEVSP